MGGQQTPNVHCLFLFNKSRPPVLVFSPITDLIFKSAPLQLCCRWSLLKIKSVIGEKTCNQSTQIVANSIYMIVLNVLHSARRKLSMKLQPQLPVPPFPHAFLPFLMPSFPSPLLQWSRFKNQVSDRVHRHVIRALKLSPTLYT